MPHQQARIHDRELHDWERTKIGPPPDVGPDNNSAVAMVHECWHDLDTCRPSGGRFTGSIPFDKLVLWAEVASLDEELFALLKEVIQQLDTERTERLASLPPPKKGRK